MEFVPRATIMIIMWSAIPIALLYMIVSRSKRKQGTFDYPSVYPEG